MKKIKKINMQEEELYSRIEIQQRSLQTYVKEIYENIGQVLSLARLQLLSLAPGKTTIEKAHDSGNLVGKAITDLRNLTKQLFPEEVIRKGFAEALSAELKRLEEAGLCKSSFSVKGKFFSLEEVKELVVFCVMQQLIHPFLNNKLPAEIKISVLFEKNNVRIRFEAGNIHDQALITPDNLEILEERLQHIDGTIKYRLKPTKNLQITLKK